MTMLDEQVIYPSWLLDSGDASRRQGRVKTFHMLSEKIAEQLSKWDGILSQDLPNLTGARPSR